MLHASFGVVVLLVALVNANPEPAANFPAEAPAVVEETAPAAEAKTNKPKYAGVFPGFGGYDGYSGLGAVGYGAGGLGGYGGNGCGFGGCGGAGYGAGGYGGAYGGYGGAYGAGYGGYGAYDANQAYLSALVQAQLGYGYGNGYGNGYSGWNRNPTYPAGWPRREVVGPY